MAGRLVLCMLVCPGEICTGMPLAFDLCSAAHARSTDVAGVTSHQHYSRLGAHSKPVGCTATPWQRRAAAAGTSISPGQHRKRPRHSHASSSGEQAEQCMSVMPGLEATAPMGTTL